jgi:hypothetical protein
MKPLYKCNNKHEFDAPREDIADVTLYEARYENTYVDAPDAVPVSEIKRAAPRPSDQLSIEEIDLGKLEKTLVASFPRTRALLASFFQASVLREDEASDDGGPSPPGPGDAGVLGSYSTSMADTRASVLRSIKQRRGQLKFRNALLSRYGNRCVVTGCDLVDVLEAAHIWPYRGEQDNHPENGLLLRADIHTLFDLDLLSVEPSDLIVRLAPPLAAVPAYATLEGSKLQIARARPAAEPLARRWEMFVARWRNGTS